VSGLSAAGSVDAAIWAALNSDQASGHAERVQPPARGDQQQRGPQQGQIAQSKSNPTAVSEGQPANSNKGEGQGSGNQQKAQQQTDAPQAKVGRRR